MIEFIGRDELKKELQDLLAFLRSYLADPITHIKKPPQLHWQTGVVSVFALNILFGIVRAALSKSILNALLSFIITPFLAVSLIADDSVFGLCFPICSGNRCRFTLF